MKPYELPPDMSASDWFAQVRSGEIDPAADQRWSQWLAADARNERDYEARELAWALAAEARDQPAIRAMLADMDQRLVKPTQPAARGAPGRRLLWPVALAASVALLAVLTVALVRRGAVSVSEYSTAVGEQRVIELTDHSRLSLNTGSHVRVSYSRTTRRIDLFSGEVVFAVTKDPARPFQVHALHGVTTAVGTQFDVQLASSSAAVSVLEGTVSVVAGESSDAEHVAVTAGQAVDYSLAGAISVPRPADVGRIRGWQASHLVFSDVSLAAALEDYNRYRTVPIVLGEPQLGERRINGVFRIGDEEAFLGALQQGLHVRVVRGDAQIVLQPQ